MSVSKQSSDVTAYSYHLDLNQFTCQKWQMNQQLFTDHNTLTAKQHIEQWLKSGIKQSKYCNKWGVNVSTFANWYQKYKRGHKFQSKVLVDIKPPAVQYIEKSECRLDNNMVENTIRPFVVGRKNWLFHDSQKGASASAFFYSLIQTAKANGLEPYWYLWYLFEQLPYATRDTKKLRELLPMYVNPETVKKQS